MNWIDIHKADHASVWESRLDDGLVHAFSLSGQLSWFCALGFVHLWFNFMSQCQYQLAPFRWRQTGPINATIEGHCVTSHPLQLVLLQLDFMVLHASPIVSLELRRCPLCAQIRTDVAVRKGANARLFTRCRCAGMMRGEDIWALAIWLTLPWHLGKPLVCGTRIGWCRYLNANLLGIIGASPRKFAQKEHFTHNEEEGRFFGRSWQRRTNLIQTHTHLLHD